MLSKVLKFRKLLNEFESSEFVSKTDGTIYTVSDEFYDFEEKLNFLERELEEEKLMNHKNVTTLEAEAIDDEHFLEVSHNFLMIKNDDGIFIAIGVCPDKTISSLRKLTLEEKKFCWDSGLAYKRD